MRRHTETDDAEEYTLDIPPIGPAKSEQRTSGDYLGLGWGLRFRALFGGSKEDGLPLIVLTIAMALFITALTVFGRAMGWCPA